MKIPAIVIGFCLVGIGKIILSLLRAIHLKRASESVRLDASKEVVLRYAVWYYIFPLLCFGLSAFSAFCVYENPNNRDRVVIAGTSGLFMFFGGVYLLYRQLTARIKIFDGKLIYTEGSRWVIASDEVESFSLNGFAFLSS